MNAASGPDMERAWFADLAPRAPRDIPRESLLPDRARLLADLLGPEPASWAVELGATMTTTITDAIPELAVDAVAHEIAKGCEAVALGVLYALAVDDDVSSAQMPEVLAGPMEVVVRGIGIEHMLRSIHLAHSTAVSVLLDAAEAVIPEDRRFTEMRRINQALFGVVEILTKQMADEYARAHEAWLTSSVALRMEVVEDLLQGKPVSTNRAARVLGYDLNRWHLAVIAWTGPTAPAEPHHLNSAATEALSAAGCTALLILPLGAQRVWAWGSRTSEPLEAHEPERPLAPGVHLAVGTPGAGVDGFRRSHQRAAEAVRVGAQSARDVRWFAYADLDIVAMLSADMSDARDFVTRELGELAGTAEPVMVVRQTLKRYLDRDRSLAGTAADLQVARNTVAYRVQRAEQLRGHPIAFRRLQLHAALTLAEELGEAVLRPTPD
ncbi:MULTISPECIES: PucR family transcriptional regulator [Mycobacteriaceae]|uniref:PucR family transcriptional regulator n=1 Tax=Mycolicibacterium neoaurum VKM Ac-1815D TaxID=700508 RepID=V5X7P4_MYCNE|nr:MULTISPECIES: helix-turn-helix domain-containing protein [Mycobacteriaceae]AHC24475.1 PucR family transcriptional regulator [Mycolicibacterium neoaurum VKM Ac-1815D]AMO05065.1 PucR family transcriptional regulator [Mycolicibacterium neoaurum]KJQ52156.1 PucR family transcriptional regulator [Mycolicibacterium neoaurum]KUM07786.1 PucR family transcriptional regulator [Mycolicibacterium neoaurum]